MSSTPTVTTGTLGQIEIRVHNYYYTGIGTIFFCILLLLLSLLCGGWCLCAARNVNEERKMIDHLHQMGEEEDETEMKKMKKKKKKEEEKGSRSDAGSDMSCVIEVEKEKEKEQTTGGGARYYLTGLAKSLMFMRN
ncbi:unnamed protein product [Caenorhabditis sp. 36 PRJEB53466]|nr:unnamed protein product [Caenorhabditis sp. 36 PRJEB53466]